MSLQQGFLFTRHWRDTPICTEVKFWLAIDVGPQQLRLPLQTSVAFISAEYRQCAERLLCEEHQLELKLLLLMDFHRRMMMGLYYPSAQSVDQVGKAAIKRVAFQFTKLISGYRSAT